MGTLASVAYQCGWVPEGVPRYVFLSTTNYVHFDSQGNPSRATVSVTPFRETDNGRTQVPVNSETNAQHYCVLRYELNGTVRTTLTRSSSGASFRAMKWARFDLVSKGDATLANNVWTYQEKDVLASIPVMVSGDGTVGGFTSIVFIRNATKPAAAPTGGTYGSPVPTSKVNGRSWSDAPPDGDDPLWMSRAYFTQDMAGDPQWSLPVSAASSSGIDIIYSQAESPVPAVPSNIHPYTEAGDWGTVATDAVWMAVAVMNNGAWENWEVMRVKGEGGRDGEDAVVLDLDNEMAGIPCDAAGNPTGTGTLATSQATVYRGASADTGWGFSISPSESTGCTSSIGATTGKVTVTAISADKARVVVVASKGGLTRKATMGLYKVKPGSDGEDAVVYSIETSDSAISRGRDGSLTPGFITAYKCRQTGSGAKAHTTEKTLKYQRLGVDTGELVLAAVGASGASVSDIPAACTAIRLRLYSGATLIDTETVPVVTDGPEGPQGEKGDSAVVYGISLTPDALTFDLTELKYNATSVSAAVTKTVGRTFTTIGNLTNAGLSLTYTRYNAQGQAVGGDPQAYTGPLTFSSVQYSRIDFTLKEGNAVVAVKTLGITTTGKSVVGPVGPYIPPPRHWSKYPSDYQFQDGSAGCTRKDIVYFGADGEGKLTTYECVGTHVKSAMTGTDPQANSDLEGTARVWNRGDSYDVISTRLLLAMNAYIELLSSQGVRIYNQAGQIVGQMAAVNGAPQPDSIRLPFFIGGVMQETGEFGSGQSPLFAVDENGKTYHGGIRGQRIEIDPYMKEMNVYDTSGSLVATHSARTITLADAVPAAGTPLTKSVTAGFSGEMTQTAMLNGQEYASRTEVKTVSSDSGTAGSGRLRISVPQYSLAAKVTKTDSASTARIELRLKVYVNGTLRSSYTVDGHTNNTVGYVYKTTAAKEYSVPLGKGDTWQVRLELVMTTSSTRGDTGTYTATSSGSISTEYVLTWYRCHYGGNGWVISYDSQNYEYCLMIGGKLHRKIVSSGTTVLTT